MGLQKHVRGIEPTHLAAGLCCDDLIHVSPAQKAVPASMQAQHRTWDLPQSVTFVHAKHLVSARSNDLPGQLGQCSAELIAEFWRRGRTHERRCNDVHGQPSEINESSE